MGMEAAVWTTSTSSVGGEDTFNWTLGRHNIKLGGSYTWNKYRGIMGLFWLRNGYSSAAA